MLEQQPGGVVPALDHEKRLVLLAAAPLEPALAGEALHWDAVLGWALRIPGRHIQGVMINTQKTIEIGEAVGGVPVGVVGQKRQLGFSIGNGRIVSRPC